MCEPTSGITSKVVKVRSAYPVGEQCIISLAPKPACSFHKFGFTKTPFRIVSQDPQTLDVLASPLIISTRITWRAFRGCDDHQKVGDSSGISEILSN